MQDTTNSEKEELEIKQLIATINKPISIWDYFKSDTYKGKQPILFLIIDKVDPIRAKKWSKALGKLTKAHVKAIHSINYSFEIESFIEEYKIHSLFILDLSYDTDSVLISSKDDSIQSFLANSFSVDAHQFSWSSTEIENLPIYMNTLTTFLKIGKAADLYNFFHFLFSFIHIVPKLSLKDNESITLCKSDKAVEQNIPYNRVELHPTFLTKYQLQENDYVIIYNPLNFAYTVACVKSTSKIGLDEIITTSGIKNRLEIATNAKIVLHPLKKIIANNILIQDAKNLANGDIIVSPDIFQAVQAMGTDYLEVFNRTTSTSFDIKRAKIKESETLSNGSIKMSYLQREFLDFEHPPDTLSNYYFDLFNDVTKLDTEQIDFLKKHYDNKKVHEIKEYKEKQNIKKILKQVGYNQVVLYPLYRKSEIKKKPLYKKVYHLLLRHLIRSASLKLKVIRPYSTDESSNIVRMSKSAMSLLGITENDLIRLHYRKHSIVVPVLEFDSTELIKEVNIVTNDSAINISIGIPAHLRYKLGIKQIGKICEVERNLHFLFIKNFHLQFLPVLASVFAIFSINDLKLWTQILMTIAIVPFSMYITLSAVREKIPKK